MKVDYLVDQMVYSMVGLKVYHLVDQMVDYLDDN